MTSDHVLGLLAEERVRTRVRDAEQARLARTARRAAAPGRVQLVAQGALARAAHAAGVQVRPIRPEDADLLVQGFESLSAESRYLRFLYSKKRLTETELRWLTEVDHHRHEALVAVSRLTGRGAGVARYIAREDDPTTAEVAVTVVDDWQRRGIGSLLLRALVARAWCEGVRRFTALVAADNAGVRRMLAESGLPVRVTGREHGAVSYEVDLRAPAGQGCGEPPRTAPVRLATAW